MHTNRFHNGLDFMTLRRFKNYTHNLEDGRTGNCMGLYCGHEVDEVDPPDLLCGHEVDEVNPPDLLCGHDVDEVDLPDLLCADMRLTMLTHKQISK